MSAFLASCQTIPSLPFHREILENGTVLCLYENANTPLVCIDLFVRGGSAQEEVPGSAHFLEHLFFRRSPDQEKSHPKKIKQMGGTASGATWYDYTHYTQTVSKENFLETLISLRDSMTQLSFSEEIQRQEKSVILTELQERQDRFEAYLTDRVLEATLRKTPYTHSPAGTREHLESLKTTTLENYYQSNYHPAHFVLSISGDICIQEIQPEILPYFSASLQAPLPKKETLRGTKKETGFFYQQEVHPHTFHLGAGFLLPPFSHPDRFPLLVAERYAVTFLQEYLRKDFQRNTHLEGYSFYLQSAGVLLFHMTGGDPSWVQQEFLNGIQALREQNSLNQTLFRQIKQVLLLHYAKQQEDLQQSAFHFGEAEVLGHSAYFAHFAKYLERVEPEEVLRVFKQYLTPEYLSLLAFIPLSQSPVSPPKMTLKTDPEQKRPPLKKLLSPHFEVEKKVCPPRAVAPEKQKIHRLSNGITVVVRQRVPSPINTVGLFFRAGTAFEAEKYLGTVHFLTRYFEERLYHSQNKKRAAWIQLGGDFQIQTTLDLLWGEWHLFPQDTESAIALLPEIFAPPQGRDGISFEPIHQELQLQYQQKAKTLPILAQETLRTALFPNHPYGQSPILFPNKFVVPSLETLQQFYQQHFVPEQMTLVLVGDFEEKEIFEKIEKTFQSWPQTSSKTIKIEAPRTATKKSIVQTTAFQQSALLIGVRGCPFAHSDYQPLLLLQRILAERAFQILVQQKSLAYHTSTLGEFYGESSLLGLLVLVAPEKEELAKIELQDMINSLTRQLVSSEELKQAKLSLLFSQRFDYRTNSCLAQGLGFLSLLSPSPLPDLSQILKTLTAEELLPLAKKYFSEEQRVEVLLQGRPF